MCLASGKLVWNAHPLVVIGKQTGNKMENGFACVEFYLEETQK
jgi:hypothetical protein